jgi:hypothetical protein
MVHKNCEENDNGTPLALQLPKDPIKMPKLLTDQHLFGTHAQDGLKDAGQRLGQLMLQIVGGVNGNAVFQDLNKQTSKKCH